MAKPGLYKLRLNSPGVLEILKSPGVLADVTRRATAVQAALPTADGEQWFLKSGIGRDRAFAMVGTENQAAKITAAEKNALQQALDRGR